MDTSMNMSMVKGGVSDYNNIYTHKALNYAWNGQMNFPHEVKQVEWTPIQTFASNYTNNDIIRFTPNGNRGDLLNPYGTFVEIVVDCDSTYLNDETNFKNKMLQLDGSAQSFISSFIATINDVEVERINQYDMLANFLKDVCYDNSTRTQKDYEGNGGISTPSTQSNMSATYQTPLVNDSVIKPCIGIRPEQNLSVYIDQNNRVSQGVVNDFVTRNLAQNYTQTAWTPYGNVAGTTWNSGSNNDEIDNNWTDNARTTATRSTPSTHGLFQAFNPTFATNGFEPWFSKTVPLRYLKSGFIKTDYPTTMTFQIPLYSSFFGHLLPPENWKLIPLWLMGNMTWEFTLNPHALFTSWFTTDQTARNYRIKKFSIKCEMIKVSDQRILGDIEQEFSVNGLKFPSQAFYYGPSFTVVNGAIPTNMYINLGFTSLRNLFVMFTPNDYLQNAAFRKHYRLSMAITSIQLLMGTDYYPQQPITGNGGTNYGTINNNEFIKNFWKCWGKQCGGSPSVINQHNFAINCREADPTSTDANYTGNQQFCYFGENRIIGKCVYGIPLDPLNYEGKMWSGKDTTKTVPWQLLMNYDNTKVFPRNVTMHTWMHHDYILVISPSNVQVIGRS